MTTAELHELQQEISKMEMRLMSEIREIIRNDPDGNFSDLESCLTDAHRMASRCLGNLEMAEKYIGGNIYA